MFRSNCSQVLFRIVVLKHFAIFTGKHLYCSIFLVKLHAWSRAYNCLEQLFYKTPQENGPEKWIHFLENVFGKIYFSDSGVMKPVPRVVARTPTNIEDSFATKMNDLKPSTIVSKLSILKACGGPDSSSACTFRPFSQHFRAALFQ